VDRLLSSVILHPSSQSLLRPESCPKIKQFAKSKGVEFTMMNKVDVNGPDTHPVYMWLKMIAGPPRIIWNFATYFVIEPTGTVSSFSGVDPMELKIVVQEAMSIDEKVEL
jgi:glutathione peroxidase